MSEHSGEHGAHTPTGKWDPELAEISGGASRWSPSNHPVGYILGVSPGFSQMGQGEERLINMGLARKIVKAARLGFDFTEIDYEALSEMYEPYVDKLIKHVKEVQNMEVGLHLPVKVDLCIANAFEWKEMHEILRKGAYSAREVVGAKFFLFHTSSRIRPHVTFTVGHQEASVQQNSFSGMNLGQWMDEVDNGKFKDPKTGNTIKTQNRISDWFKAMFTKVLYHMMGMAGDVGVLTFLEKYGSFEKGVEAAASRMEELQQKAWEDNAKREMISLLRSRIEQLAATRNPNMQTEINHLVSLIDHIEKEPLEKELNLGDYERAKGRTIAKWLNNGKPPEESIGKLDKKFKEWSICEDVKNNAIRIDFDKVFDFWVTKGSECEEQIAYRVVAKFMYWTKDPLWKDIVGDYDPDIIIKCADLGKSQYDKDVFTKSDITEGLQHAEKDKEAGEKKKTTIDDLVKKLITAVACKYIEGHLYVSGDLFGMAAEFPEFKHLKDESVYNYTKDAKMMIFIETSMPPEGQEGELRIMSAHDHVELVKHLDKGEITGYTMDFEHLTVNFVRVTDDIKSLKEGDAKYIKMMHINAPRPIIGAHAPIPLMSHDMFVIYEWLFDLRKKGMKNAYFIWEMGGFGIDQSAIAFRNMVIELAKDTGPKDLPKEFYGLDDTLWAAQHHAIRNHGLDPLKGMIMVPEIDHGVLSKAAHEKGKAKEWEEEKYKY